MLKLNTYIQLTQIHIPNTDNTKQSIFLKEKAFLIIRLDWRILNALTWHLQWREVDFMMMPGFSLYNHKNAQTQIQSPNTQIHKYKHTNTQVQTHKYTCTFIQVQISNIHTPKHEHICGKHEPLSSHRDAQAQRRVHTAAIFRLEALKYIYGAEPTSNVHGFCIFNPKLMYHPLIIQMAIVFVNKKLEVVSYPLIMMLQLMDYRHIMLITKLMANVHICYFKYFSSS